MLVAASNNHILSDNALFNFGMLNDNVATLLSSPSMQVPFSQLGPCLKLEAQGSGGAPQPADSIADA